MVKKIKTATQEARGVSSEELKRIVRTARSQAEDASEAAGLAGQVVKDAIDKHNLNRKALRFVMGISKMDEAKRQDVLRSLIDYAHKLDMFASIDAFDDMIPTLEGIAKEIRDRSDKPRDVDPTAAAVMMQ